MASDEGKVRLGEYASGSYQLPMPGLRLASELYPSLKRTKSPIGTTVTVPIGELGNGLPAVPEKYSVEVKAHRLGVIVPSKDRHGVLLDPHLLNRIGDTIIRILCEHAGGTTGLRAVGSWVDPVGVAMHENVHVVETYADEPWPSSVVEEIVGILIRDLQQETAALHVGAEMMLVSPNIP